MGYLAYIRVNDQGHHQDQRCMIWTVLGKWAVEMSAGPWAYLQLKDKGRPQEGVRRSLPHGNLAGNVSCQWNSRGNEIHCGAADATMHF